MYSSVAGKVIRSGAEFENQMYHWGERRGSRRGSVSSGRSNTRPAAKREVYREPDLEAQVLPRVRRDAKRSFRSKDDAFVSHYQNAERFRQFQEEEPSVSDIRENWRMRVMKENAEKMSREKKKPEPKKQEDEEEESAVSANWNYQATRTAEELQRSKSTPDVTEALSRAREDWVAAPEQERKKGGVAGSMLDIYTRNWGVYNEQQEADSLNDPTSLPEPVSTPEPLGALKSRPRFRSGKSFFGQLLPSRASTPSDMLDYKEPFSQLWVILSSLYGQVLIIMMLAFCLTEVMDNSVKLLTLQGVFLMYLYVGSIAVIICIYIWVLIDSCASLHSDSRGFVPPTITTSIVADRDGELGTLSMTKFGSLKKAHISRDRTSNTSFYLRVGAIAFGLGTLVFNGLEMAMHSMMEGSCLNDVVFVHPVLHGLFTFLQMHFLFVNSQVLVERFGLAARFGFMHLAATNLALWVRLVVWESGNEWTYFVHLAQNAKGPGGHSTDVPTPLQLRGFPKFMIRRERDISFHNNHNTAFYQPISEDHISQVVSLHHCLNTNSLGQLWTSSMPFLYPFIIQFSLIAAAVTFVMGQNVARDRLFFQKQKKVLNNDGKGSMSTMHDGSMGSWGLDCSGASKGLFLGLLCLVAGIVVIIIFLVVKEDPDFPQDTIFWLTTGTLVTILSITVLMNVVGLVQIRKLSVVGRGLTTLDSILSTVTMLGVQLYTVFGMVVGAVGIITDETVLSDGVMLSPNQKRHAMLLSLSAIQLVQATMQSGLIGEGIRRTSLTRNQILTKPARQVITYLMFSNAVLWAFDTFVVQSWISQELQLRFFGVLAWGVVSRVGLPLLVFFRFHSAVLLLEIWKKSYQSLHLDPGN